MDGDIALLRNDGVNLVIEIESRLNIDVLLGGDSTLYEINITLRLDAHAALDGSERVEVGVTTSRGHDVAVVRDDVGSGGDVTARGDGCVLLRGDHSGNLRILAGFDGCVTGSDGARHNDISPGGGDGGAACGNNRAGDGGVVLRLDGDMAVCRLQSGSR